MSEEDPTLGVLERALEIQLEISRKATETIVGLQPVAAAPPISTTGWTLEAFMQHWAALRASDDRRYAEVNVEKEKALKIKETADLAALQLAREIQTYKDEKANELRSQIESERGSYATKEDLAAAIRELAATRGAAIDKTTTYVIAIAAIVVAIVIGKPF
jgi:hypothetical protein